MSQTYGLSILFLMAIVVGIAYYFRQKKDNQEFARFGQSVGFISVKNRPPVQGGLFSLGNNSRYSNVLSGTFDSQLMYLFEWHTTLGEGNGSSMHEFTVAKTPFNEIFPDFYLLPQTTIGLSPSLLTGSKEIKLEGQFPKYFRLYINEQAEVENLELFTPNFMQLLIDAGQGTILFSVRGSLYWLREAPLVKPASSELPALYNLVTKALPQLKLTLKNDDFATAPQFSAVTAGVASNVKNRQGYMLLAIPVGVYILLIIYMYTR